MLGKPRHLRRWHGVDLHQLHLIAREGWGREYFGGRCQCVPDGKRDWNEEGRETSLTRNGSEKLLVRVSAWATVLEDCRTCLGSLHDKSNRFRDIFHIDRLQSGSAAAEHRIDAKPKELEDSGEKRVIRSEHDSRTDKNCIGERAPDRQFAFAALLDVAGWRGGIGTHT